MLPHMSSVRNPIDLAGAGEADFFSYSRVARALLEADELDGVLMTGYFGGYSQYSEQFADTETEVGHEIARAAAETGKPLVAQSMYADDRPNVALREGGVPVYWTIEAAAASLAALEQMPPAAGPPALPEQVAGPLDAGYFGSRALLADAGVPFVAARRARTREDVLTAAAEVGYPVVLKALGLLHKSDAGGVRVGLADADALAAAWSDMEGRLSPPEYSVEAMAPLADGIELIVGARRDPRFGPVALVGLGGIYAELLGDVGVALAPLDRDEAVRLLESLQGAALLKGGRRHRSGRGCGGGAVAAGGGAPRHRGDRGEPAAGHAGGRAGTGRAHHSGRRRRRRCWLTAATTDGWRWSRAAAAGWAAPWPRSSRGWARRWWWPAAGRSRWRRRWR
jgi:hypothetical protein